MSKILLDFETRSVLDVRVVGAWKYAEHPSTEILCLQYKVNNEIYLWVPGLPFPQVLIDHVNNGGTFEAHNVQFEYAIWLNLLTRKLGIPVPFKWVDTLAVCAYRTLPLGLDQAGDVCKLNIRKDKRGKYLLQRLSKPRKPTVKEKKEWQAKLTADSPTEMPILWTEDYSLLEELYDYCKTDVASESELGFLIGDLPVTEQKLWVLDQTINKRGVYVDVDAVNSALAIVAQVTDKLTIELRDITNQEVQTAGQRDKIIDWIMTQGVQLTNLTKDTLETMIKNDDESDEDNNEFESYDPAVGNLPPKVRRVIEIRQQLSRASTKKLQKILWCMCDDGRLHGMLQYFGASTGRWAGRLAQPHNFPRGNPDVLGKQRKPSEGMDLLIAAIKMKDADLLTLLYGDPMDAIATALRGMFIAEPGKVLRVVDFASIEARVTMWLADQEDALQAFVKYDKGEGPNIYCAMAEKLYGRPIGKHEDPKEYVLGKITILGCFAADTLVLTNHGIKHIIDVNTEDQLWDGFEWVNHQGLVDQGKLLTINLAGIQMTQDHQILAGNTWVSAIMAAQNENVLSLSLAKGLENLPSQAQSTDLQAVYSVLQSGVRAGRNRIVSFFTICCSTKALDAIYALNKNQTALENIGGVTLISSLASHTGQDCLIEYQPVFNGVTTQTTTHLNTMENVEYTFTNHGVKIGKSFFDILSHLKDGITQVWTWTEKMLTKGMNQIISDLSLVKQIWRIVELLSHFSTKSLCWKNVYDIALAGPRNRFTILSNKGPLIVHNCGYQMGPDKLMFQAAKDYKVILDESTAIFLVQGYRQGYDQVPKLWYGLQQAALDAIENPGNKYRYGKIIYQTIVDKIGLWLTAILPNGRRLWYKDPSIREVWITFKSGDRKLVKQIHYWGKNNKKGGAWSPITTYGGMLTENVVQAIARDFMAEAMLRVEAAGYPLILTVHDELIAEMDPNIGSLKDFVKIILEVPKWGVGCPIAVEAWEGTRYRK